MRHEGYTVFFLTGTSEDRHARPDAGHRSPTLTDAANTTVRPHQHVYLKDA